MADKTASGSGGSSAQDSSKKVGLIGLVGIVISAMIGGGIYNLPQNMAADASAGAIIIAWVVTGIGIWFIANTFRILSAARPELTNGLYTYAEKGFGKLIGFFVAYGYWICNCFAPRSARKYRIHVMMDPPMMEGMLLPPAKSGMK